LFLPVSSFLGDCGLPYSLPHLSKLFYPVFICLINSITYVIHGYILTIEIKIITKGYILSYVRVSHVLTLLFLFSELALFINMSLFSLLHINVFIFLFPDR
jgi:hypothetical protein